MLDHGLQIWWRSGVYDTGIDRRCSSLYSRYGGGEDHSRSGGEEDRSTLDLLVGFLVGLP